MQRCDVCENYFDPMYEKTCTGKLIDYGVDDCSGDAVHEARKRARRMGSRFKSAERTVRMDNQLLFVRAWTVRESTARPCHHDRDLSRC